MWKKSLKENASWGKKLTLGNVLFKVLDNRMSSNGVLANRVLRMLYIAVIEWNAVRRSRGIERSGAVKTISEWTFSEKRLGSEVE